MRRTLRDVGRIRAGASDVVLRMSVGVHSGAYAMFLVGGSHRELLIGGPAASQVVAMESAASAGQILVSPETAERLPRGSVGDALGPGRAPRACAGGAGIARGGLLGPAVRRFRSRAGRARALQRPAIQEVAYSSLPFKLRRELHMAVGLRLEHDSGRELDAEPAILSHHFSLAGDYGRAHRYAMAAAQRATEQFSHADAARLYRRAIG